MQPLKSWSNFFPNLFRSFLTKLRKTDKSSVGTRTTSVCSLRKPLTARCAETRLSPQQIDPKVSEWAIWGLEDSNNRWHKSPPINGLFRPNLWSPNWKPPTTLGLIERTAQKRTERRNFSLHNEVWQTYWCFFSWENLKKLTFFGKQMLHCSRVSLICVENNCWVKLHAVVTFPFRMATRTFWTLQVENIKTLGWWWNILFV